MLCKCSGKYIDIYFNLKITFYTIHGLHGAFRNVTLHITKNSLYCHDVATLSM